MWPCTTAPVWGSWSVGATDSYPLRVHFRFLFPKLAILDSFILCSTSVPFAPNPLQIYWSSPVPLPPRLSVKLLHQPVSRTCFLNLLFLSPFYTFKHFCNLSHPALPIRPYYILSYVLGSERCPQNSLFYVVLFRFFSNVLLPHCAQILCTQQIPLNKKAHATPFIKHFQICLVLSNLAILSISKVQGDVIFLL